MLSYYRHTQNDPKERGSFSSKAVAPPRSNEISIACSSSTTAAVREALAFVPVFTVYVCGWCTAGEPRQHFLAQCNTPTQIVGPHARYTKQTAGAKAVAHIVPRDISLERPFSPILTQHAPGTSSHPHREGRRFTSYGMHCMIIRWSHTPQ